MTGLKKYFAFAPTSDKLIRLFISTLIREVSACFAVFIAERNAGRDTYDSISKERCAFAFVTFSRFNQNSIPLSSFIGNHFQSFETISDCPLIAWKNEWKENRNRFDLKIESSIFRASLIQVLPFSTLQLYHICRSARHRCPNGRLLSKKQKNKNMTLVKPADNPRTITVRRNWRRPVAFGSHVFH